MVGGLAWYSNYGPPFEIGAPGSWSDMLDGGSNINATYTDAGTSYAAPTVAGIAGLIAAGDLATYAIPDGDTLKAELLSTHAVFHPGLVLIPGARVVTMSHLP